MPLTAVEGGAVLGRGKVMPEAADGDCTVAERCGLATITNRPLRGIPIPGAASGDWGRKGAEHLQFLEKKPMGVTEALLKRVILEATGSESTMPFQQLALRLALSTPIVSSSLCGIRSERYVEDASAVLREAPFSAEQVSRALVASRHALEELGGESRRFW